MSRPLLATLSLVAGLSLAAGGPAAASQAAGPRTAAEQVTPGWQQSSTQTFSLLDALQRSQGVATDGRSWFFSWQYGLSHVTLDGKTTITDNPLAIPSQISQQGGNHIGDIDDYNGTIYAPIEDGSAYQHPYIALYNAVTDVLDRNLPSGTEAEGLAFLPEADGSVMHTLDVAPSRLAVNFRSYRP